MSICSVQQLHVIPVLVAATPPPPGSRLMPMQCGCQGDEGYSCCSQVILEMVTLARLIASRASASAESPRTESTSSELSESRYSSMSTSNAVRTPSPDLSSTNHPIARAASARQAAVTTIAIAALEAKTLWPFANRATEGGSAC